MRLFSYIILAAMIFLIPVSAFAEGETIAEVAVKGNRRIETAAILNAVKIKAGDILYAEKADADVRAIYALGYFDDVQAEGELTGKGFVLSYVVKEKPFVREIVIQGNKELNTEKVRGAIDLKGGAVFSRKELTKSINKVKKLYMDEGYYLAEVEGVSEQLTDTELKVIFRITEGAKVLIKRIEFEGNKVFTSRKLRKVMETKEKWFLSWLTGSGTYKEEVLKNDANLIIDHYYNNGYVNVKVGEPSVRVMEDKSGLIVTIGITEGAQFKVGTLDFKGDLLEDRNELPKKLKLKTGEIFSRAVLRGDVITLTDVYADKGYAFANITPLTKLTTDTRTIDITFDMEKGEKVYIERINVAGNLKTRDKVLRREVKLAEGDLYSSTAIKRSKQSLTNLGYFEEVNLATAKGSAENKLNINVDVKEKATGTFSIGGGYSSIDGFIGQGSVQQANFLGLGLKANASVSIGGKSSTYNLGLTDPYFLDTKWTLGADIYRTERDYIDFSRRVTGGDIKTSYPLSDFVSTFWMYKFEKKKIFNISPALAIVPEASGTTSSVFGSINRNTTDYRLDPTTGMINNLSIEFAGLGGTSRFAKYIGETTWFTPLFWSTVFSAHGTLGYIQEIGKDLPIDEKFYLGGINTLRGFKSRSVSPVVITKSATPDLSGKFSESSAFIGGNKEAVFNFELTFPLLKDVGVKGVTFFDIGNSYGEGEPLMSSFLASYGAGIRWFSPIGPLRLEYGIPINPRPGIDDKGGKLEFSIGAFF